MISAWDRASLCAVLATACPHLFGGILMRAGRGPVLSAWIDLLAGLQSEDAPTMTLPATVTVDRLHKSLSVAQSLSEGRPIYQSGLLEQAQGRALIIHGVERVRPSVAAAIASELEAKPGGSEGSFSVIAIDESRDIQEPISSALVERLAFRVDMNGLRLQDIGPAAPTNSDVARVRDQIHATDASEDDLTSLASACAGLGIGSMRVPIFCLHAAQGLAALNGRAAVLAEDIAIACQLVLPGRGQVLPQPADQSPPEPEQAQPDPGEPSESSESETGDEEESGASMAEQIIQAVASAPVQLIDSTTRKSTRGRAGISGRSGAHVIALDRGRPDRPIRGQVGRGRIDLLATLRAAAPLQPSRRGANADAGLQVRKSDLRIKRFKRRRQSSVIFVVDASGSAAMHRMAEAKGAVERLLSQCYARRDLVSLISFAGEHATIVLPPSRSLVRARRQISDLAGGGATPLAHALVEAFKLARAEHERGRTPFLVFLTDGRGNMTLEGAADRAGSTEQASRLAKTLIRDQFPSVFFDTSRRPDPRTRRLSDDLGAQYQFLPTADGDTVSKVVRQRIGSR